MAGHNFSDPPSHHHPDPPPDPLSPSPDRSLDTVLVTSVPKLAFTAESYGLFPLAAKLRACRSDAAVYRRPDGSFGHAPMGCGHRLCPACTKAKTAQLRSRIRCIAPSANLHVTLTCATAPDDSLLRFYIRALQSSLRLLTQRKPRPYSDRWLPFSPGYMWKLEVTPSLNCFHPHIHLITAAPHISHEALTHRWAAALRTNHLHGGHLWITAVNPRLIHEMSKYLAKGLSHIHPSRWASLDSGLFRQRAYGSGGSLTLPPAPRPRINTLVGFLSRWESDPDILDYAMATQAYADLLPDSPTRSALEALWNSHFYRFSRHRLKNTFHRRFSND